MARHGGGGHGRGGFFGRRGRGDGDGFRMGRRLGSGDLQLLILLLLQESPRHGYELIKELEQRTSGYYSPSPGVIYPALTYLDEIGFASVEADGNKKLYRISETGARYPRLSRQQSCFDRTLQLKHLSMRQQGFGREIVESLGHARHSEAVTTAGNTYSRKSVDI